MLVQGARTTSILVVISIAPKRHRPSPSRDTPEQATDESAQALWDAAHSGDSQARSELLLLAAGQAFAVRGHTRPDMATILVIHVARALRGELTGPRSSVSGWLRNLTRAAASQLRGEKPESEVLVGELPEADSSTRTALDHLETADDFGVAEKCLETLPAPWRRAVMLRHYSGMSNDEVAAELKQTAGNTRTLICRGLKRLRECVAQKVGIDDR